MDMVSLAKKTLIVVMGPTCVGKTACCIGLAQQSRCEIVSADARQCYREMSIGTAKPTDEERAIVPHHLVDFLSVKDYYSAGLFEKDAMSTINALFCKRDTVLLTGGSGLYLRAVCEGLAPIPAVCDVVVQQLKDVYRNEGLSVLLHELENWDPVYYRVVDKANPCRILRALAVCRTTKKPFSYFRYPVRRERSFKVIKIGLQRPRDIMRERIGRRVDMMIKKGLVEEVWSLYSYKGYRALQTIGYQEFFDVFDNKSTIQEAIAKVKTNTCRYLKRQMTWLRKERGMVWFSPENLSGIKDYVAALYH